VAVYPRPRGIPPAPPGYLNDITYDGPRQFFTSSDSGDRAGQEGRRCFKIDAGKKASPGPGRRGELAPDLVPQRRATRTTPTTCSSADFSQGYLFRLDLKTKKLDRIGSGFGGTDRPREGRGRAADSSATGKNGKLFELVSENEPPQAFLSDRFQSGGGHLAHT